MAVARDIVTIRGVLATARVDETRDGTWASAVPGRPARPAGLQISIQTAAPTTSTSLPGGSRSTPRNVRKPLGINSRPRPCNSTFPFPPRESSRPSNCTWAIRFVAEALGLQFLFPEEIDSGVVFLVFLTAPALHRLRQPDRSLARMHLGIPAAQPVYHAPGNGEPEPLVEGAGKLAKDELPGIWHLSALRDEAESGGSKGRDSRGILPAYALGQFPTRGP